MTSGEPPDPSAGDASDPPAPSSPSSPGDDRVAVLAAHLRANHGRYTDEALRASALAAGYTDAELREARAIALGTGWAGQAPSSRPRVDRRVVATVAIGYVVILYALISTTAASSTDLSGTVALAGLLGGVIAWAVLRNERPSLAQGIGCGVILAVVIPIVAIVVIIGICVVAGSYPR
jgi:hypothetical protein